MKPIRQPPETCKPYLKQSTQAQIDFDDTLLGLEICHDICMNQHSLAFMSGKLANNQHKQQSIRTDLGAAGCNMAYVLRMHAKTADHHLSHQCSHALCRCL